MIEFGDTITDERGREDLGHVAGGFPAGCYFDDLSHKTIPWHWHGEMEAGDRGGREDPVPDAGAGSFPVKGRRLLCKQ